MIRRTRSHGLVTDRTRRETRQIENLNEKIIGRGQNANSSTRNKRANVKTRHLFIQTVFTVSRDSILARKRWQGKGMNGKAARACTTTHWNPVSPDVGYVSFQNFRPKDDSVAVTVDSRISGFDVPPRGIGKGKYKLKALILVASYSQFLRD